MLKVKDVLKTKGYKIWSVPPAATAYNALEVLADKKIGAVLVMEGEHLAGIFSERDYARKVILKGKASKETPVSELMTNEVYSVNPERGIEECMALMSAIHVRHLPVIEDGKVTGVLSLGDCVSAVITAQKVTIQDLTNYITG